MKYGKAHKTNCLCCVFTVFFLLSGCNGPMQTGYSFGPPTVSNPSYSREAQPLLLPCTGCNQNISLDENDTSVHIDVGHLSKGYIAVTCTSPVATKLIIENNSEQFTYTLNQNGTTQYHPLTMGNGHYQFTVYTHLTGNLYQQVLQTSYHVQLEDNNLPFLMPNAMVEYSETSEVVSVARQLTQNCCNDTEVLQQIQYWITQNFAYDYDKASAIQNTCGYTTNLEEILREKKGICLDFAVLTSALLRANGIPCKLVLGTIYLEDNTPLPHAWNMVWTANGASYRGNKASGQWKRLDMTMAISGEEGYQICSDDSRYIATSHH